MICTFGDITGRDVVARAQPAGPRDHPGRRHAASGDLGRRRLGVHGRRRGRRRLYDSWRGLSASKARAKIVEQLKE